MTGGGEDREIEQLVRQLDADSTGDKDRGDPPQGAEPDSLRFALSALGARIPSSRR